MAGCSCQRLVGIPYAFDIARRKYGPLAASRAGAAGSLESDYWRGGACGVEFATERDVARIPGAHRRGVVP